METVFRQAEVQRVRLNNGAAFFVLRDDLIHPVVSGNKWRKLKYNIEAILWNRQDTIITFGGAFSNHLAAVAAAGKIFQLKTIGIVRGEEVVNPRIELMRAHGMLLHFISREEYRNKTDQQMQERLVTELIKKGVLSNDDRFVIIPEGGSNSLAVKGAEEINDDIPEEVDEIFCAVGTGATVAGISRRLRSHQRIKAVAVLKGGQFLEKGIAKLGGDLSKIDLLYDFHFGGYAKSTPELDVFCQRFTSETSIPIEPVYTGKCFFAACQYLEKFPQKNILCIHSGGL